MFLAHFWSIFPIFRAKNFFWKIQLCHTQLHTGFQHRAKIQIKLMILFQENPQTNGRTEDGKTDGRTDRPYFKGPFRLSPWVQKHKTVTSNLTQSNQIFCSWLFLVLKLMRDGVIKFKKVKAFFIRVKTSLESKQCAIHIKQSFLVFFL